MTECATQADTELSDEEIMPTPGMVLIEDLGCHSLALREMAFTFEDEFDLDSNDEKTALQITTVDAAQGLVAKMLAEQTS